MRKSVVGAIAGLATLVLVSGCSTASAPGLSATSYPAGNSPNDHQTAATGFGLGPEDFKSNGGAFGPDNAGR